MTIAALERVTDAWRSLASRERAVLIGGGIALALLLVYGALWLPMRRDIDRLQKQVPLERTQIANMRLQAAQTQQLRGRASTALTTGTLTTAVEQSVAAQGLKPHLTRLEADGANAVRVAFDAVPFNTLVSWLATLQRDRGVRVDDAAMQRHTTPGTVNARLLLRAPAP